NVNLDLENTSLDNVQSNTHIEHYQQSRSPSVEPQNQRLSNQNYYLVEDESSLPLQMSRRSINSSAQLIEPQINSFSE
ncbi:6659_t:CDS:2, partial [Gigaspora margarita]